MKRKEQLAMYDDFKLKKKLGLKSLQKNMSVLSQSE